MRKVDKTTVNYIISVAAEEQMFRFGNADDKLTPWHHIQHIMSVNLNKIQILLSLSECYTII